MTNGMKIDFAKYQDGLVPAIIQDDQTRKVLMLGFMNQEALSKTIGEGKVTFFSRSKNRLWTKGEESGNYLLVKNLINDCDNDSLLIKVHPLGPVCHTGADTCWNEINQSDDFLAYLELVIAKRRTGSEDTSYVKSLFRNGINKIAQKVGEEAIEMVIEAKDDNKELFLNEAADLLFHYLVLLQAKEFTLKDVISVLKKRHQPE